ncbi:MAG TPA: carboxypeptidase-like regulatory domain-containing protein [Chitinophaga sp.]|nr:carboxypeptidase-like regulatory domain-containing protein [Chitinophaga sp.]
MKIYVSNPCTQSWENMTPEAQGRYCQSCCKTVTDFSGMTDQQIMAAIKASSGNICGRFLPEQLDRELVIPNSPRRAWLPAAVFTSLLAIITPDTKAAVARPEVELVYDADISNNTTTGDKDTLTCTITGKVLDARENYPIVSASITLKGTKYGTVTDTSGNFRLTFKVDSYDKKIILEARFIGYETKEIKMKAGKTQTVSPVKLELRTEVLGGIGWIESKPTAWQRFTRIFS